MGGTLSQDSGIREKVMIIKPGGIIVGEGSRIAECMPTDEKNSR